MAWPEDRRRHIEGLKTAREILRQPALKPFLQAERLPGPKVQTDQELFEYTCANAKTQHHPVGTCKTGVDDMSVVSPELNVHGIDGLRVCDSSIMPTIYSSNTNAATITIGEKLQTWCAACHHYQQQSSTGNETISHQLHGLEFKIETIL